eukprot:scaffold20868_cov48-Phaeocystis_antarctica.AAC.1
MAEVDPLGDSGRRACKHLSTRPSVFVGLTDSLAYRVPYNRPARTMPWGMEKPARRWLAAARCAVPQVHDVYAPAATTPPGTHRTRSQCDRPGGVTRYTRVARPPEVAHLRSPHTDCSPAAAVPVVLCLSVVRLLCLSTRRRLGRLQLWPVQFSSS